MREWIKFKEGEIMPQRDWVSTLLVVALVVMGIVALVVAYAVWQSLTAGAP